MGSEATTGFSAFHITAQLPASGTVDIPSVITPEMIREKISNAIFPLATIKVEPFIAEGDWWNAVEEYGADESPSYFQPWHDLIQAFEVHPQLRNPVFVSIGDSDLLMNIGENNYPPGCEMTGSALPRMPLALTHAGSIVGLFSYVVHT